MSWIVWVSFIMAGVTVFLILVRPFSESTGRPSWMPHAEFPGADLIAEKEHLLRAMKDVEFEFQNGSLSPEDRDVLRAEYKRRAIEVIQKIDAEDRSVAASLQAAIEDEVMTERRLLEEGSP